MRQITNVIAKIDATLPPTADVPGEVADQIITLRAEMAITAKTGAYLPPEANSEALWNSLGTALYRYMPSPDKYPWAKAVSNVALGLSDGVTG